MHTLSYLLESLTYTLLGLGVGFSWGRRERDINKLKTYLERRRD